MNDFEFTEEEVAWGKASSAVPEEVRGYMSRQHENHGVATAYYMKVAAKARAEADAILATRQVAALRGETVAADDWKRRALNAESTVKELTQTDAEKDRQITHLLARDSMAVHSED